MPEHELSDGVTTPHRIRATHESRRWNQFGQAVPELLDECLIRFENWRARPIFSAVLVLAVGALAGAGWWTSHRLPDPATVEASIPYADGAGLTVPPTSGPRDDASGPAFAETSSTAGSIVSTGVDSLVVKEPVPADIIVHVSGDVGRPGLVELSPGSRVADAVRGAGGANPTADVHRLNLAAVVADGTQIIVPSAGEEFPGPLVRTSGRVAGTETPGEVVVVNLNTASGAELESLPGIGPATASAIETWREQHGMFRSVEELLEVPGIGPAKMAALVDLVQV